MTIFLTMDIHPHFIMDIINLLIGFIAIPWGNIMSDESYIPNSHNSFHNKKLKCKIY